MKTKSAALARSEVEVCSSGVSGVREITVAPRKRPPRVLLLPVVSPEERTQLLAEGSERSKALLACADGVARDQVALDLGIEVARIAGWVNGWRVGKFRVDGRKQQGGYHGPSVDPETAALWLRTMERHRGDFTSASRELGIARRLLWEWVTRVGPRSSLPPSAPKR